MLPSVEPDCTWSVYLRELQSLEAGAESPLARLEGVEAEEKTPAVDVLLRILVSRDPVALDFGYPPEAREQAARALMDLGSPTGLLELSEYLREHWFYDGETEEVTALVEKLHGRLLRPYRGLDGVELAQAIEKRLLGRTTHPEEPMDRAELARIRLVAWAVKDHVPFVVPHEMETLEDLGDEIEALGL